MQPRGIIQCGTRIICSSFKCWGTGPTDRAGVAVQNRGTINDQTVVQFNAIPNSGSVIPGEDTVYVHLYPPYMCETGWRDEGRVIDLSWLSDMFASLSSIFCM